MSRYKLGPSFLPFYLPFCLLFTLLILSLNTQAGVRIAFLEVYNSQGKLIQYEPNGRFGHTALQFDQIKDQWLNAYPDEGVAVISWEQLQTHGNVVAIVELPLNVDFAKFEYFLGRPFDFEYSWSDQALYCTELIAKLLNVPTHPMKFNPKVWPPRYWKLDGTLGLSPDNLYTWALSQTTNHLILSSKENEKFFVR